MSPLDEPPQSTWGAAPHQPDGLVEAVAASPGHTFSKDVVGRIRLRAGLGVVGDAHAGATVRHRSRVARDPRAPNLRQVHLVHAELLDELSAAGFAVSHGRLGENITTRGITLLDLPTGTRVRIGQSAVVEITGLRNPCSQLDDYQQGLMSAVLSRDAEGRLVRKAGVMAIVLQDGEVAAGDRIRIVLPPLPHRRLEPV